ncbi:MAG: patatin-like phospholipase family protein, partial [Gemmatimonadota bacterium]
DATRDLKEKWTELRTRDVMHSDPLSMAWIAARWMATLASGGSRLAPQARSLVDNRPLEQYLTGLVNPERIRANVDDGRLRAAAVSATSYHTGRTITFVQGASDLAMWRRPQREARRASLTLDHVMASSAIPLLFPAVRLEDGYYGDGSVRQTAPLAPAIHLGAAVSSRYPRDVEEARQPAVEGYPPVAQIAGVLANSSFLDTLETDARWLRRVNRLVSRLPEEERGREPLHEVDLLVLRPSRDLGRLAAEYEQELPRTLRFLSRGLGTRESESPDLVSYLLFERGYLRRLIELGERDAERQWPRIASFLGVREETGTDGG